MPLILPGNVGSATAATGYDVAKFIEEGVFKGVLDPIDYAIHSANPVGANNIDNAMKSAFKLFEE